MASWKKYLVVKKSTIEGAGKGLFTKKMIPKGTKIIEYKGKITSWNDADHQGGLNAYLYYVTKDHVIDAFSSKNEPGRYMNDAVAFRKIKPGANNCKYVQEGLKVFIYAKRDIAADAELFVRYGKKYWDVIQRNRRQAKRKKLNKSKS